MLLLYSNQAEENRIRKEEDLRQKREEESKKDEEKQRKKEEEKARREAILQQFKLKKELENNEDVSRVSREIEIHKIHKYEITLRHRVWTADKFSVRS